MTTPVNAANEDDADSPYQLETTRKTTTAANAANEDDTDSSHLLETRDGWHLSMPPMRTTLTAPTTRRMTTAANAANEDNADSPHLLETRDGRHFVPCRPLFRSQYFIYLFYFVYLTVVSIFYCRQYILYLIYLNIKTRRTRPVGVGFQRVTLGSPVAVPTLPIPAYPRGFVNP